MEYEAVIGLEVHAELATRSKMFCGCEVVDPLLTPPNSSVCPICAGMPGTLPVVNRQAVEYALRVALALQCQVAETSIFARKNYFYPDLPKGYQISQYEYPLAQHGKLTIQTSQGEREIRVHRVHLEEDTGKLTHLEHDGRHYSLVDLNRAGVPLLEIVSEPDMHSPEEAHAYGVALRSILQYLGVTSGNMQKGAIRFEANVSVRPRGSDKLGTRVEIKNLNSFRALERSSAYEIQRQIGVLEAGGTVRQETAGWDEVREVTFTQRSKEEANDYRYFPEPDLPPLVVEREWVDRVAAELPELPAQRTARYREQLGLPAADAALIVEEPAVAAFFEASVRAAGDVPPNQISKWIVGELFGWMNHSGESIDDLSLSPSDLADLVRRLQGKEITQNTAKEVLAQALESRRPLVEILEAGSYQAVSDSELIADLVRGVLSDHPKELESYLAGKETLFNWFFGQVMRIVGSRADPRVVREELQKQLSAIKQGA
jgi:aspartyl-tRNA(Asn)/glutamyl-tRNA(Gln) amidotransferase subunit B